MNTKDEKPNTKKKIKLKKFMVNALSVFKSQYPAFNEMEDQRFLSIVGFMTTNLGTSRTRLLHNKGVLTPIAESKAALDAFRLPEGWGHFLRSFTDQLVEGIPLGMSLTAIADIAGDPYSTLLLQIVRIYSLFIESRSNKGKTSLDQILTRQDAREIVKENEHLGALMSNAEELLNLLGFLTKLKGGETRLHKRIFDCVERLLETP